MGYGKTITPAKVKIHERTTLRPKEASPLSISKTALNSARASALRRKASLRKSSKLSVRFKDESNNSLSKFDDMTISNKFSKVKDLKSLNSSEVSQLFSKPRLYCFQGVFRKSGSLNGEMLSTMDDEDLI